MKDRLGKRELYPMYGIERNITDYQFHSHKFVDLSPRLLKRYEVIMEEFFSLQDTLENLYENSSNRY